MRCCTLVLVMCFATQGPLLAGQSDAKGIEFFERKIRPVLAQHCLECHSASGKAKGKLQLDSREAILKGGASGPAAVPGKPETSMLLRALRHEEPKMPPKQKLSAAVIDDFATWITMGLPFPAQVASKQAKNGYYVSLEEGRKHWAFQPPKKPPIPSPKDSNWARSDIDRFILAGLEKQKLTPVREADPLTLLRRLSFDLIGLPPTPEEIGAFKTAYQKDARGAVKSL